MESQLLKYLSRNLSEDDIKDLCDHVDSVLDADDVTSKIRKSTELSYMLRVLLDFLWRQDGATLALLLRYIQQDYNFIAYRIRKEYQLSHNGMTDSRQDQSGLQLMLVSRPPDPLSCHPMKLSVPSQHHEQWDHVITFAYTAPQTSKLDYCIKAELSGVVREDGHVIRAPAVSAVPVFRCAEKCRAVSSDGTVPQISLWCRFKGYPARTTQTVNFTLHATSETSLSIECASTSVDFQVKSVRKKKQEKKTRSRYRRQPSQDLVVLECDSSERSRDTSAKESCDTSQSGNEGHMTTWAPDPDVNTDLVYGNFEGEQHLFQLFPAMPKSKAFVYETNFGRTSFMSMFKMFVGLMNNPRGIEFIQVAPLVVIHHSVPEFNRLASRMRNYFSDIMPYSDMRIVIHILESTQAYAAGDVEKSYRRTMRSKQLVAKARNPAVALAESNIQLVGVFRRLKKFGAAVKMIEQAQQVMCNTELCQTHAMVCKCEATLYSLMLQNSPHPNPLLRTKAIKLFRKAIDILHQTDNFHASPEHHIKECYVQLAEVYVDIPSSDIRSWRHVSTEDICEAEICLQKAEQMICMDFYGRGRSKLKLTHAKLLIRKGQLTEAAQMLEEGIRIAQTSGAQIDAQYCTELLTCIKGDPDFALQKMKELAVAEDGGGGNQDGEDGDADTTTSSACTSDNCETD